MITISGDIGGTFTDILAIVDGREIILKIPTVPGDPARSLIEGARSILPSSTEKKSKIDFFAHSTTIATNAILGQVGLELPKACLVATKGFRDVLEIGRQNRASLYDLNVERPKPIITRDHRYEVIERMTHNGALLEPLDEHECKRVAKKIKRSGTSLIAISFLNSYKNPLNERRAKKIISALVPRASVDCSSDVNPEYREYERTSTTVVNLVLKPILSSYIAKLDALLHRLAIVPEHYIMQSSGGLVPKKQAIKYPAKFIESGPAAGLIAATALAKDLKLSKALSLDMGGTTAKSGAIISYRPLWTTEFEVGGTAYNGRKIRGSGYPVRFQFLDLVEVSAGGGSIAWCDGAGRLHCGPVSAGAEPGPACYGKGGISPTVTDAHLVLGRIPDHLIGGSMRLDLSLARQSLTLLNNRLGNPFESVEKLAIAIIRLSNVEMSRALRIVTLDRGLDPSEFSLICFGGAGPLHACELAEELSIDSIVVPEHPGMFSTIGVQLSKVKQDYSYPVHKAVKDSDFEYFREQLLKRARKELGDISPYSQGWHLELRFQGQSFSLMVRMMKRKPSLDWIENKFLFEHKKTYGFNPPEAPVELLNIWLSLERAISKSKASVRKSRDRYYETTRNVYGLEKGFVVSRILGGLEYMSNPVEGPAVIELYDSTIFVKGGWTAQRRRKCMLLKRKKLGMRGAFA
ncbi:MAG: hydantoinase/oxoprolinase family protein [Nitrososphaerales archaeon]